MQDISDYRSNTIKLCNLCLLNQYTTEKYAGYHNKVHHPWRQNRVKKKITEIQIRLVVFNLIVYWIVNTDNKNCLGK